MKPLKLALRIWITITSLLSFLVGWALLSHAPKPASIFSSQTNLSSVSSPAAVDPLPTLAPIPSLDSILTNPNTTVNLQPLPSFTNNTSNNNFLPSFRTRGS
jgi:hypothetical protein